MKELERENAYYEAHKGVMIKKQIILFLLSLIVIQNNVNADIMTELAKRDRNNPIRLFEYSSFVLYARNGYLHTEYRNDDYGEPSIVMANLLLSHIKYMKILLN